MIKAGNSENRHLMNPNTIARVYDPTDGCHNKLVVACGKKLTFARCQR